MELWVVEMSKTDPLSIPLSPLPKGEIGTYLSIKQDKETGNWWAADVKYNGHVSKTDPLSIPLSPLPKGEIGTYLSIKQDKETGNWWAADVKYNGHGMNIGYWPKELFDLISTNAGMVGVTGAVQASPSGKSPPMGNGYLPTKNEMGSARVRDANIIDSNFKVIGSKKYKLEKILDSDKCYGLRDGRKKSFDEGTYVLFTYGGPGGDFCGV
ncbi:hypothetical protein F2Q70_00014164 [Brassica cretica]|uniref:Neprosin PEP catalytic domain-containing protein n=1 Tax=Brassica cretica TaxID=69181 RepID=A0A8S9HVB3_BRACR|nr:hypothetical protein F2Q70_00014164 [Brassica cretica]